jgi:ATP-dependent DNA helicase PIF1
LTDKNNIKKYVQEAVKRIQVLIVEEISMVENQILERMNFVMQSIRESDRPFGGAQVIILGDFHQLPPVKPFQFCLQCGSIMSKRLKSKCLVCLANDTISFTDGDKWAFKAPVWERLALKNICLRQVHRQKESSFQDILHKIRYGEVLSDSEWRELEREKVTPPGIYAVRLMSLRKDVDAVNQKELAALNTPAKTWEAQDYHWRISGDANYRPWEVDQPLKDNKLQPLLTLKIGAKVVLLTNLDPSGGLVNGSQGLVVGFRCRERSTKGRKKEGPYPSAFYSDRDRTQFEPVVRFANGTTRTISPINAASRHGTNQLSYMAQRVQIPLMLAWALSIHKSQGMTLEYVEVSSKDLFEPGQFYVGLSRATHLEGLTVTGFSREQLGIDSDVLEFYQSTHWQNVPSVGQS